MVVGEGALAGVGLPDGDPGLVDEAAQSLGRLRVDHAPAGDQEGSAGRADQRGRPVQGLLVG